MFMWHDADILPSGERVVEAEADNRVRYYGNICSVGDVVLRHSLLSTYIHYFRGTLWHTAR
jgi:hypothetical protein